MHACLLTPCKLSVSGIVCAAKVDMLFRFRPAVYAQLCTSTLRFPCNERLGSTVPPIIMMQPKNACTPGRDENGLDTDGYH
jgi:hypothetical protein